MKNRIFLHHAAPGFTYSNYDEDMYFEWITKISCIVTSTDEHGLEIDLSKVTDNDLLNLISIFDCYNLNKSQLDILKTEQNKHIFDSKRTINNGSFQRIYYEYNEKIIKSNNIIILTPLKFSTREEESLFFNWLDKIKSIKKIEGVGKSLYLYFLEDHIKNGIFYLPRTDKLEIEALFNRYKFKNKKQLKKLAWDLPCSLKTEELIKKKVIKKKEMILIIIKPEFYSLFDYLFFEKLSETSCCIKAWDYSKKGIIELFFLIPDVCNNGLKNLFALFDRYQVKNKKQLNVFKNDSNKHLFIENKKKHRGRFQYLHQLSKDPISFFSTKGMIAICCSPLLFYTERDKELFFERIKMIKSLNACELIGPSLYLYFMPNAISKEEILDLMALFDRYELDNYLQLELFKNEENKDLF